MKDVDALVEACELQVVRPFHSSKVDRHRRVGIDLIAVLDPLEDLGTKEASGHQARNIWLSRSLPRAFESARVLAYRRTEHTGLELGSEIDIEAHVTRFLTLLSGLRKQTNTVRYPHCYIRCDPILAISSTRIYYSIINKV